MQCSYCGKKSINSEMYIIRMAIRPRGRPNRWKNIGVCCESCHESKGKQISFGFGESVPSFLLGFSK